MSEPKKITVRVVNYRREFLMLRWTDPVTGQRRTESSGCTTKRAAWEKAGEKEDELNARVPRGNGSLRFSDFMLIYAADHLESLSDGSRKRSQSALAVLQKTLSPETIGDVTGAVLSAFAAKLRKQDRSESTIATNLRTIRAALKWAVDNGHLAELPTIPKQARAKATRAKGRPLTDNEFIKLLRAVRLQEDMQRLDRHGRRTWRRLLIGLWLSGLRLDEALRLTWNHGTFSVDASGKYPLFVIREQKSGKEQTLPITPDFGRWLLKIPKYQRTGFVFPLAKERQATIRRMDTTSKVITAIGKHSGVIVNSDGKHASAHDLRRSFGLRWASRVMPAELQALMRHENIATTMSFYALVAAESFAEKLWKSHNSATPAATENQK